MKFKVDGEDFEIPDKDVIDYVAALSDEEIEVVPPNKFIFGLNVSHTGELAKAGEDIRAFIDSVGDGEVEVQVSINAKLNEVKDMVVGFDVSHLHVPQLEPAIGEVLPTEYDEDDDDYDYPEEDKLK